MTNKETEYIPSENSSDEGEISFASQTTISSKCTVSDPSTPIMNKKYRSHYRKKRTFSGKRFLKSKRLLVETGVPLISFSTPSSQASLGATVASIKLGTPTSSSKNVSKIKLYLDEDNVTNVSIPTNNLIINSDVLQGVLDMMSICRLCKKGNLKMFVIRKISCTSYLLLRCDNCNNYKRFWSVSECFRNKIQINDEVSIPKRNDMVYSTILGGRLIGCNSLTLYHTSLNIPSPPSQQSYFLAQKSLVLAAEYLANASMDKAKYELCDIHGVNRDDRVEVIASYDGAYQQRSGKSGGGFSRYCFASCIAVETGKVLSYGVACNSCSSCNKHENLLREDTISLEEFDKWKESHLPHCPAKFINLASVHLESAIAPQVVCDALDRGIIFTGIVSDGNNKIHETLEKSGVYKILDRHIDRLECLSHVCKRLKSNLYKAQEKVLKSEKSEKAFEKKKMISDKELPVTRISTILSKKYRGTLQRDKTLRQSWAEITSSKEIKTLSEAMCAQITSYYRRAVQSNKGNMKAILQAIRAIPYHLGANDDNCEEYHKYCPDTSDSWCKYKSAVHTGKDIPVHPNYLSDDCVKLILKLYEDFGYDSEDFVWKISDGMTSNHNESIQGLQFRMVRKSEAVGIDIMRLGSALAVIRYNDGFSGISRLYNIIGIELSQNMIDNFTKLDKIRVVKSSSIIKGR